MYLKQQKKTQKKTVQKKKDDYKFFFKYIEDESKGVSYELFEKHFNFTSPTVLTKQLYKIKNKKENNELVELIRVRWSNLIDEIEKMSEDEKETEKPDKILKIVEEILIFNREN